jgi:HSP20 family protein
VLVAAVVSDGALAPADGARLNALSLESRRQPEREGMYRSERSHGSFSRGIPLPEGTITDQAKASFENGVLEITMPAPPEQVSRGRRLEITETTPKK